MTVIANACKFSCVVIKSILELSSGAHFYFVNIVKITEEYPLRW